ncbi:MAG: protein-methionine-sulfoxide reductase catalytic subunit MsrP [Moraxellaceae bacterium]|nr:MAG: protein-methionine-sulfoxide reductase catalytic subunit MsrP [Moraxellaceae bacterium]
MLIQQKQKSEPASSEITAETSYLNRRQLMSLAAAGSVASLYPLEAAHAAGTYQPIKERSDAALYLRKKITARKIATTNPTQNIITPYDSVTTYNNFYEFGTGKSDPSANAGTIKVDPWRIKVDGLCNKPGTFNLEDILAPYTLEDRIYRFRCVEAWSMVVPWLGFPLAQLIKRFQPKSNARFIQFTTLLDPKQLPNQNSNDLDWPYIEALRLDEALHPLAFMAVGLYGRSLPDQNGAPFRLIVPWKYGFKSIKSIVGITFTDKAPVTTWLGLAPQEYGFYANVNPNVDHPRWSQARERQLPNSLFNPNWKKTLPFNGYGAEVAALYKGMDLKRFY